MNNYEAGYYIKEKDFRAFVPYPINKPFEIYDLKIISLLEKAGRLIGELNAYSKNLPNIQSFLWFLSLTEANSSNKIEGTKITLNEIISPEEDILPELRDEKIEILNYLVSLEKSYERITGTAGILTTPKKSNVELLPFCTRLIKEAHKILLTNSRGKNKNPGKFRTSQNWIGGTMPSTASFVPPPCDKIPELLSDFENFWHNDDLNIPILIKIAISHYQFETIHPFLDGNGRIGRLIILMQLVDSGILELPTLYLSKYFEKNRKQYYDALNLVREKNDINQWVKYFLEGVCDISKYTVIKLKEVNDLNNLCEEKIKKLTKSHVNASRLLKLLYKNLSVKVNDVARELNLNYQVANALVKAFVKMGILHKGKQKRNTSYIFRDYFNLFVD
ncbi:MAG TPA: Fic family protein [Candidatus Gastranaerophilaceae bacterium]|nr:Fic family protein [Candidatus Gastranaerophilaceae bacterium]HPT41126.1 Fic family protein [Candidatus Gastranaerophilaceae bacterium]